MKLKNSNYDKTQKLVVIKSGLKSFIAVSFYITIEKIQLDSSSKVKHKFYHTAIMFFFFMRLFLIFFIKLTAVQGVSMVCEL